MPTGLYAHSWCRWSSAFLSGAGKLWLYSGVTRTNASARSTRALHCHVCSCVYWRSRGWLGSSMSGRLSSARSATSTSKPPCASARSVNQRPTGRPARPWRVLAMMIWRVGIYRPGYPRGRSAPHLARGLHDEAQLRDLLLVRQRVALDRRGEPALGRQTELVDVHVPGRLLDAALELVLGLEVPALGGDQAEDDELALGDEAQRLEAARALVVPLHEQPVHAELVEQRLGHEVVAALGHPRGAEVAAAWRPGRRGSGPCSGGQVARRLGDAAELVDEVHVPRGAAELAVGGRPEPHLLLHAHDLADGVVLGGPQRVGVDRAGGEVLARLQQRGRPEQAAHMVGAVGRSLTS